MTELAQLASAFLQACKAREILVATAESCTGGRIIASLTDLPGASAVVDRGFVTYSNEAKIEMIGVSASTLAEFGAVSAKSAAEMAAGALAHSRAGIALSVTGIAGPDGGSAERPVGLVWFGLAIKGRPLVTEMRQFQNLGRAYIRQETTRHALEMGLSALEATTR